MTIESFQDTLFEDPIGLRFRHAREKARWSQESVAQQLKLPVAVLDAIEREDWARLGAPIFVRSYVGSYARLLGLPASLADDVVRGKPAPQLVAIGGAMMAKRSNRNAVNLVYVLMTVLIVASVVALAMYFQSPRRSASVPLDMPGGHASIAPPSAGADAANQSAGIPPPPRLQPMSMGAPAPAGQGSAVDPEAKVARFTVSSEGTIAGN